MTDINFIKHHQPNPLFTKTYTYLPIYLHFYQNYRFYSIFASYFPMLTGKIWKKIVKWFGKYGRKASWIVKWYGKYGRKVGWIVKRYGKYRRKVSWIEKRNVSISFHYSIYFSSIFSKSFHYSAYLSSIFPLSFHYFLLDFPNVFMSVNKGLGWWCLMPYSTILLLFHGSFYIKEIS
jgi:hypothetical protein